MRRDYLDVEVRNVVGERDENSREDVDEADRPILEVTFDGPSGMLAERMAGDDGSLEPGDVDVTYRTTDGDESGVLSVSNRLTGEFLFEANVDADRLLALVRTARGVDGDGERHYRVRVVDADGTATVHDKRTLLVYDADGSLRRQDSLIPGGVEL